MLLYLEVDILFQICDHFHHTGRIMYSDFQEMAPETYMKQVRFNANAPSLLEVET
jgi:hypothetical protein